MKNGLRGLGAAVAVLLAAVTVFGASASASADTAGATPAPRWIEAGPPDDPEAIVYADFGTSNQIRIWRERYGGTTYGVWAENVAEGFTGHFHFWGPGINVNSPNQKWYWLEETRQYYANGRGTVCVEGWKESYLGARDWQSIGLPCLPT